MMFRTWLIILLLLPSIAYGESSLQEKLRTYIAQTESKYPGLKLGFELVELGSNNKLYSHNADRQLIPASTLKILSTYAALKKLGGNYRFMTEFYSDRLPSEASSVGNIYVRGYGDPSLVNEDLLEIAHALKQKGVREVKDIVIDDTLFLNPPAPKGEKAYLAGLSSVSLNFNSYVLSAAPSKLNEKAFLAARPAAPFVIQNDVVTVMGRKNSLRISQDPQSGAYKSKSSKHLIGSFEKLANKKISLVVRGNIGRDSDTVQKYLSVPDPSSYFAESFKEILESVGIKVLGKILLSEVPARSKQLYVHKSRDLSFILKSLNYYSNNFIAGQILYSLGQDSSGYFDRKIGLTYLKKFLQDLGLSPSSFSIYDASGLNKNNRLSASILVKILKSVYSDLEVLPDFTASLSRYDATGTLKKRKLELIPAEEIRNQAKQRNNLVNSVWAKTGTLDGVSSLAGYLELQNSKRAAFSIILNSVSNKDLAMKIEDRLVEIIISSI